MNWFRQDRDGRFLWPGFGDNIRVLDWILKRVDGEMKGSRSTPLGHVPTRDGVDLGGLDIGPEQFDALVAVEPGAWLDEAERNWRFLDRFGRTLPDAVRREHRSLIERLRARPN